MAAFSKALFQVTVSAALKKSLPHFLLSALVELTKSKYCSCIDLLELSICWILSWQEARNIELEKKKYLNIKIKG
jgi:hypothetical protein